MVLRQRDKSLCERQSLSCSGYNVIIVIIYVALSLCIIWYAKGVCLFIWTSFGRLILFDRAAINNKNTQHQKRRQQRQQRQQLQQVMPTSQLIIIVVIMRSLARRTESCEKLTLFPIQYLSPHLMSDLARRRWLSPSPPCLAAYMQSGWRLGQQQQIAGRNKQKQNERPKTKSK